MTEHSVEDALRNGQNPLRARTLIPPGAFNPIRIHSRSASAGRHFRVLLPEGVSLYDGIVQALKEHDVASASMTLLGGWFSHIEYCTAPPDPQQQTIVRYTTPIPVDNAYMVFGNATLGKSPEDKPLVHCHAAIADRSGTPAGGHVVPPNSILGPGGMSMLVLSLDNFELRMQFDVETNQPLLKPNDLAPTDLSILSRSL